MASTKEGYLALSRRERVTLGHLKAQELDDSGKVKLVDGWDNFLKEGDNNSEDSTQHVANECKDTGQQLTNQLDNPVQDRKNIDLDSGGDEVEDTFNEPDDNLDR